ncbi:MAG: hypothetical protein C5S44_10650 [Candidatus Methanocomedens sp.]|nr:MAG: hypothetical protein C5S44_10650 [ANME-2 cluster archaeon]
MIADYFKSIENLLSKSKLIADKTIDFKEFSRDEGMVTGRLLFFGGFTLNFMEYILIEQQRPKYRFNLSDSKGKLIFRYDNAPHHKEIPTFPHHKHLGTQVKPSEEVGLEEVISEIEIMILTESNRQC